MCCVYSRPRNQVSVYRTIGPLVSIAIYRHINPIFSSPLNYTNRLCFYVNYMNRYGFLALGLYMKRKCL